MKKKTSVILLALLTVCCLCCCGEQKQSGVVATTAPVQQFAQAVCKGTPVEIGLVISDSVSCLHDYSLSTRQMMVLERAEVVILTGSSLETFLEDAVSADQKVISCANGIAFLEGEDGEPDPHIWLSPDNAAKMSANIADGLGEIYPEYAEIFHENAENYAASLQTLKTECKALLSDVSSNGIITFHDGFAYFADAFGLRILAAIEEESGSEASAKDLKEIINLVTEANVPCVFTEKDGSTAAAEVISAETGCRIGVLSTGLGGDDYFDVIRTNVRAIAEGMK